MLFGVVFSLEVISWFYSCISCKISGPNVEHLFSKESGGHCWHQPSPTDKRGRTHTSTVTVAVLKEPSSSELSLNLNDLSFAFTKGSGPGGQHKNATMSCVVVTHLPTKLTVRCQSERSQHQNKALAVDLLRAKLLEQKNSKLLSAQNQIRRQQVGTGNRGDKIRTVQFQNSLVTNNLTGKKIRLKDYLRGAVDQIAF